MSKNVIILDALQSATDDPISVVDLLAYDQEKIYTSDLQIPSIREVVARIAGGTGAYLPLLAGPTVPLTGDLYMGSNSIHDLVSIQNSGPDGSINKQFNATNLVDFTNVSDSTHGWIGSYSLGNIYSDNVANYLVSLNDGTYQSSIGMSPATGPYVRSADFKAFLKTDDLTADRIFQFPDQAGTIALTSDITPLPANAVGFLHNNGSGILSWDPAGTGSVTSVSIVTANGISGSVASPTSTPAITLTLAAITPTSVNGNTISTGTGTLSLSSFILTAAANATVSGTNTGDQTITLNGQATGSGIGALTVTLDNSAVIGKVLTGYTSAAGTVSATDSILSAIEKLNGNTAAKFTLPSLTAGSVLFSDGTTINQDNANFFYDATDHRLGLGVTTPLSMLHLVDSSTSTIRGLVMDNISTSNTSGKFYGRKSNNGGAITSGWTITNWTGAGHDGTQYTDAADIRMISTGTISTGVVPGQIVLRTANVAGALTQALLIDKDQSATFAGNVSLGAVISGAWNGSVVTGQYGGTGVANTGKSITLSGNLTTTGAFNATFAIPQSTTWTLPNTASETLAGLNTAQAFNATQTFAVDIHFASGKGIQDSNAKYLIGFPSTVSSAINYIQVSNSATGSNTLLSSLSSGGTPDLNVNIQLVPLGSGGVIIPTGGGSTTPGLAFSNSRTTGLLSGSSGTFTMVASGTNILTINTNGLNILDKNVLLGTTTGTIWGLLTTHKQAWWGATPIVQPSGANQAAVTDSTGGTAAFSLVAAGLTYTAANINNNFSSVERQINEIRNVLVNTGLMKGST